MESCKEYSGKVVDSWKKSETPDNDWFWDDYQCKFNLFQPIISHCQITMAFISRVCVDTQRKRLRVFRESRDHGFEKIHHVSNSVSMINSFQLSSSFFPFLAFLFVKKCYVDSRDRKKRQSRGKAVKRTRARRASRIPWPRYNYKSIVS